MTVALPSEKVNRRALRLMFPDWAHVPPTTEFCGMVRHPVVRVGNQRAQLRTQCNEAHGEIEC